MPQVAVATSKSPKAKVLTINYSFFSSGRPPKPALVLSCGELRITKSVWKVLGEPKGILAGTEMAIRASHLTITQAK